MKTTYTTPSLPVTFGRLTFNVSTRLIAYIKGDGGYCWVHLIGGQVGLKSVHIGRAHELLPGFWRPHTTYLVNPDYVVAPNSRREAICLWDGQQLPVARLRRKSIYRLISNHFTRKLPQLVSTKQQPAHASTVALHLSTIALLRRQLSDWQNVLDLFKAQKALSSELSYCRAQIDRLKKELRAKEHE